MRPLLFCLNDTPFYCHSFSLSYYSSLTITLPCQAQHHLFLPLSSHNQLSLGPLLFS
ncbi:hypothetical protein BDR03DRAFT_965106 [Suillus americanus]|nr:hypothetical protein BDR03DRAFT_965106 [Suillus americanus]